MIRTIAGNGLPTHVPDQEGAILPEGEPVRHGPDRSSCPDAATRPSLRVSVPPCLKAAATPCLKAASMKPIADIELVKQVVVEAGKRALLQYGRVASERKADQSLVTDADRDAERFISDEHHRGAFVDT